MIQQPDSFSSRLYRFVTGKNDPAAPTVPVTQPTPVTPLSESRTPTQEVTKQIAIVRELSNGETQRLVLTRPKDGGDHVLHMFEAIEKLLIRGFKPSDFNGLVVQRYVDGKVDTSFPIKTEEVEKYIDVRNRGLLPKTPLSDKSDGDKSEGNNG